MSKWTRRDDGSWAYCPEQWIYYPQPGTARTITTKCQGCGKRRKVEFTPYSSNVSDPGETDHMTPIGDRLIFIWQYAADCRDGLTRCGCNGWFTVLAEEKP